MLKKIEITELEPHLIKVRLVGDLYVEEATEIRERLLKQIDQGVQSMTVDVSELNYIDSSGLGVLIAIHKRCTSKGGFVKIKGIKGNIKELFELTRLDRVFEIE
ncbi:STAS domain-containing protein [Bacillus sp. 31A1R]|uniref:Anti-sigma factor antagonist n=1 Tax=Robertmurraya mangrovi TaxID=3098077 RepID=A0ABU5J3U1_9BACI|nr:STAS domain-containing protein [Bacillus sp. 31A1R]MDZ5474090.1 STAS domain-containing protein [Bacillus sp. 31A1R]